ncbi:MAG: nickel pincer cofactor biosynthesis protein LarB [Deltaproteobacteria bacterium]|nr:nickel pincer cofactor biosynthesis protein LarB [Deltaproteobacteria bacterium]
MNALFLKEILEKVGRGELPVSEAMEKLVHLPFEELGFARLDHHRELRTGLPEVIWGEGKTVEQMTLLITKMIEKENSVLITRLSAEKGKALQDRFPKAEYYPEARILILKNEKSEKSLQKGTLLVVTAGTSDIPVAEEAAVTAKALGHEVGRLYDVGVAGLPRLLASLETLRAASVLIVVAGMEGALPSVVAGLVARPVIAVPTSVGYGSHLGGLVPLFAMLNSCAAGLTVVNIDNGFGAAMAAHLMMKD